MLSGGSISSRHAAWESVWHGVAPSDQQTHNGVQVKSTHVVEKWQGLGALLSQAKLTRSVVEPCTTHDLQPPLTDISNRRYQASRQGELCCFAQLSIFPANYSCRYDLVVSGWGSRCGDGMCCRFNVCMRKQAKQMVLQHERMLAQMCMLSTCRCCALCEL